MSRVGIVGLGSYVPEDILTNKDFEKMVDTTDSWITARTGIKERRKAREGVPVSELCYQAARQALEDAGILPQEVELVIVASVTPDYAFPATACLVADRLGISKAAAFDLEAGCSGFIYAAVTASQFIAAGMYRTALVIGGETLSKITNWQDRGTCVLFGDGAGAAVLQPVEDGYGFLGMELGADGSGGDLLIQPAGGSSIPATTASVQANLHTIRMAGREVFKFAVRVIEESVQSLLSKCDLRLEDIDLFLFHQANQRIIEAAARRLELDQEKVFVNLERYGNTSAASIPLALDEAVQQKRIRDGDILMMVGFGAGLTWGAIACKWGGKGNKDDQNENL
ncbi:MAG: ketoacyl-ACP synthase III [Peptococcaceae bacterium]|jgi:3-oxoacyl-[acyl-carrier-protein] synthase-3|nr:ketoacyl-ACP synthase III [Peptococcaceae bacterium]